MKYLVSSLLIAFLMSCGVNSNKEVQHIILIKFKNDSSPASIENLTNEFSKLQNSIPLIQSFEYGINNSPEKLNKGFEILYRLSFKDETSRNDYLEHSAHKRFAEYAGKLNIIDDILVFDY